MASRDDDSFFTNYDEMSTEDLIAKRNRNRAEQEAWDEENPNPQR